MRIADATKRIEILPLDTKIEVTEVPSKTAAAIRAAQVAQNTSVTGSAASGPGAVSKSPFGGTVRLRPYGEILPLFDPTNAFTSALGEAAEKPSVGTGMQTLGAFSSLAESSGTTSIPNNGPRLVGGVCDLSRFVRALKKKEPGAKFEVTLASLQLISTVALSVADLSGSAHAKSIAESFGWLVDMGDKMFVISHEEAQSLARATGASLRGR